MPSEPVPAAMSRQLEGKVALITGAGRGIGQGIAFVLASRGALVAITDLSEKSAQETASMIDDRGGRAFAIQADVTSTTSMESAARLAVSNLGSLDVCVCNAGVYGSAGVEGRESYSPADWEATFKVNVKGIANTVEAVLPVMKEHRSGRIVTIASHGGRAPRGVKTRPTTVGMPYSVSKAAAIQFTHALAMELAQFNITVNCVCPGTLWTPMWEKIATNSVNYDSTLKVLSPREVFDRQIARHTPLGRPQTPEDVGRAVAFFASDDASEITGQALNVNGGAVMN